jgi:hypothetical protein
MFPLTPPSFRMRDTGGIDRIHKNFELSDVDVTELRSFSITTAGSSRIRPGEQVQLISGESSVYRRVERIETIAGDCILIWLDPGYVTAESGVPRLGASPGTKSS